MQTLTLSAPRTLAQEAASLSSGTMATLTGYQDMALVAEVQDAFVAYCRRHPHYPTWQRAWQAWLRRRDPKAAPQGQPAQQRFDFGFHLEG